MCIRDSVIPVITVLAVLELFVEVETQLIPSLMADREVGKDKVSSLVRSIEVDHASYRSASQDTCTVVDLTARLGRLSRGLQRGKEEVVGPHLKCDILEVLVIVALEDTQLDNRRRVDGTTIGRSFAKVSSET